MIRLAFVLAALVLLVVPAVAQDDQPLLGKGNHTYRWVPDWAGIPAGGKIGNTHGCMAVDAAGRLYVNTDTQRAVMIYDRSGRIVGGWGKDLAGGLHGMTLVKEGDEEFLYLTHTGRHEVLKTTLDGKVLWRIGWPEESGKYGSAKEYRPTDVAVAPNGDIYVADGYGKSWVHQYDKNRKYVRSFGGPGREPGKMRTPHGLMIDTRGKTTTLLVADRENHRLQRFSLDGKHLAVITGHFRRPCNAYAHGPDIVVADLAGRVSVLNAKDELVAHLGDNPDPKLRARNRISRDKWSNGLFLSPHSACFDADGNIYVMDWNYLGRITKLERIKKAKGN